MRSRLLVPLVIGLVGSAVVVPSADADHGGVKPPTGPHEDMPTDRFDIVSPEATCAWSGVVDMSEGVDLTTSNHNHYDFQSTLLWCVSDPSSLWEDGTWVVSADAASDGASVISGHGEDLSQGWSHSSAYVGVSPLDCDTVTADNANKGFTRWFSPTGVGWVGWLKFVHLGGNMEIWGCLADPSGTMVFFSGDLGMEPLGADAETGKINQAALHGFVAID